MTRPASSTVSKTTTGLLHELIRQSLDVEPCHVRWKSLKRLCDLPHIKPSLLVSLQVPIAVHVFARGVSRLQVPEEDIDRDADAIHRRGRVRPAWWDEQNITGVEDRFVRMGVGRMMAGARSRLDLTEDGARGTGREVESSHV